MLQIENNKFELPLDKFNDDNQLNLSPSTINKINTILDKINPVLQFSTDEITSITNQFTQLDNLFPEGVNSPPWTINRLFISIIILQSENPEMRKKRHLDLYTLDEIFHYCDAKTYNLKSMKKTLRAINFDWTGLLYSYEEGFAYYSSIILDDERIIRKIERSDLDLDIYSKLLGEMFTLLLDLTPWKLRTEFNATLTQFVLKSILTFSEMILIELSKLGGFSPVEFKQMDIVSPVYSELSQYPNISKVYLKNILNVKKSKKLHSYILSLHEDFVKLIRQSIND